MFMKLSFYYSACDSTQNGVQVEKVTMIFQPDVSFKQRQILYQECAYLRAKKKYGYQRESTCTNFMAIFEDNHSAGTKEQ